MYYKKNLKVSIFKYLRLEKKTSETWQDPGKGKRFSSTVEPYFLFSTVASATCNKEVKYLRRAADRYCWRLVIMITFLMAMNHRFQYQIRLLQHLKKLTWRWIAFLRMPDIWCPEELRGQRQHFSAWYRSRYGSGTKHFQHISLHFSYHEKKQKCVLRQLVSLKK